MDPNLFEFFRPQGIVPAVLVLVMAWVVVRVVVPPLDRLGKRFTEWRLTLHQTRTIFRLLVFLLAFLVAGTFLFNLSQEALLALGGVVAVAVGIALKDLTASVIAGITILVDKPFQVGDRISFSGVYGEVVEIGLRSVRLVTLDDNLVTIPNNKFLTDVVSSGNAGALDMLVQIDFLIGADQDLPRAKRLVGEALVSSRFAYLRKPWAVMVSQVTVDGGLVALRLRAKVYVLDVRYEKALETDVTERVMEAFAAAGIRPPALLHRSDGAPEPSASSSPAPPPGGSRAGPAPDAGAPLPSPPSA
jgi:small-conductance mechanosensitive channel